MIDATTKAIGPTYETLKQGDVFRFNDTAPLCIKVAKNGHVVLTGHGTGVVLFDCLPTTSIRLIRNTKITGEEETR